MLKFEKLSIWNNAIDYADINYLATCMFPIEERYGLSARMPACTYSGRYPFGTSEQTSTYNGFNTNINVRITIFFVSGLVYLKGLSHSATVINCGSPVGL